MRLLARRMEQISIQICFLRFDSTLVVYLWDIRKNLKVLKADFYG